MDYKSAFDHGYSEGLKGLVECCPYGFRRSAYYMTDQEWRELNAQRERCAMLSQAYREGYRRGSRARVILSLMGHHTVFQRSLNRSKRGRMTKVA